MLIHRSPFGAPYFLDLNVTAGPFRCQVCQGTVVVGAEPVLPSFAVWYSMCSSEQCLATSYLELSRLFERFQRLSGPCGFEKLTETMNIPTVASFQQTL